MYLRPASLGVWISAYGPWCVRAALLQRLLCVLVGIVRAHPVRRPTHRSSLDSRRGAPVVARGRRYIPICAPFGRTVVWCYVRPGRERSSQASRGAGGGHMRVVSRRCVSSGRPRVSLQRRACLRFTVGYTRSSRPSVLIEGQVPVATKDCGAFRRRCFMRRVMPCAGGGGGAVRALQHSSDRLPSALACRIVP